jgi:hypothetical protein
MTETKVTTQTNFKVQSGMYTQYANEQRTYVKIGGSFW